jgi:hypothetical protein
LGTLVSTLVARIRKIIPEAVAVDWSDDDIVDDCLQPEYVEWAAALGHEPGPGWFTIEKTFTLAANATTYDLSSLMLQTVGYFAALKSCWYLPESGSPVPIDTASPGQEDQWRLPVGQSPVGQQAPDRKWLSRPAGVPTLNLHPESSVARNFRVYLRYQPPTLDSADAAQTLQTDPRHDRVLVRGAALRAMEDVGETDDVIERRYERDKSKFLDDERLAAGEFESETTKMTDVGEAMFGP